MPAAMRYCHSCGNELVVRNVDGRDRGVCDGCRVGDWGVKIVSVGVAIRGTDGRFLLGRRAEDPAFGQWALPGGYVEADELLHEAARREALEEAGVEVTPGPVIAVRSMVRPRHHDTYIVFLADHVGGEPTPDDKEFDRMEWFDAERLTAPDVTAVTAQILLEATVSGEAGLSRRAYVRPTGEPADLHIVGVSSALL
jgi:ADP-ribose pyrophosphatase YjhB (NUDIX family)